MLDLLKDLFGYFADFTYKLMNSQTSLLIFIAMVLYLLSDVAHKIGGELLKGDENDHSDS